MASSGRSEKAMSSRLLTMKFMQRAAASSPSSTNSSAHNTPDKRPSKRPRFSKGATFSDVAASADMEAVRAALAAEEAKRVQAIERQAAEAGETRWVLSFQDPAAGRTESDANGSLNVVTGGFADIDASDDEPTGRLNFGKKSASNQNDVSSSNEDNDSEEDEDDDNDPAASLIREEKSKLSEQARLKLKDRKKKREQRLNDLGDARRQKKVNLNEPDLPRNKKSRGGGPQGAITRPDRPNSKCFNCGKLGHQSGLCPETSHKKWSKEKKQWDLDY